MRAVPSIQVRSEDQFRALRVRRRFSHGRYHNYFLEIVNMNLLTFPIGPLDCVCRERADGGSQMEDFSMARKKEQPKPISSLRFDFADSLENLCNQSMMLMQTVDSVIRHHDPSKPLNQGIIDLLRQRSDAMRAAMIGGDDDAD
jgi:hypothetical protein